MKLVERAGDTNADTDEFEGEDNLASKRNGGFLPDNNASLLH